MNSVRTPLLAKRSVVQYRTLGQGDELSRYTSTKSRTALGSEFVRYPNLQLVGYMEMTFECASSTTLCAA